MTTIFVGTAVAVAAALMAPAAARQARQERLARIAGGARPTAGGARRQGWAWPQGLSRLAPWARTLGAADPSQRLRWSGAGLDAERYLALRLIGMLVGMGAGLALGGAVGHAAAPLAMALGGALAGWEGPEVWLARALARRRAAIDRELLYFLDYLALMAEAGLSLQHAMQQVAAEFPGILSAAFHQMQVERGMGQWNEDALANLADSLGHRDVATLAATLARAGRFGSRTADVLRDLAASIRAQRHEHLREQSNRAGAAIVLPVAVFILPAIVLVIGYPALTTVTAALGGR